MATIVIQCAGTKRDNAGRIQTPDGRDVLFVANPQSAPKDDQFYAHPDDADGYGRTWRDALVHYNQHHHEENRWRLLQAYELYCEPVYRSLVSRFGMANVFILSAGWGLVTADFLVPYYDITFSGSAESFKRRTRRQTFLDLKMLTSSASNPVVFVGGKDYLPLFNDLTQELGLQRIVYFNSDSTPIAPGCDLRRFTCKSPARRTNWHYECAQALASGHLL